MGRVCGPSVCIQVDFREVSGEGEVSLYSIYRSGKAIRQGKYKGAIKSVEKVRNGEVSMKLYIYVRSLCVIG